MSDLISRSRLIEEIKENQWGWFSREMLRLMLENQPTVDAVEVVRCKDCKSYIPEKRRCKSEYLNGCTIPNGYCFNGERKKV